MAASDLPPPTRGATLRVRALLVLGATLLSLVGAELFCRVALPSNRGWFPDGMYVNDAATVYRLAADFQTTIETAYFTFNVRTNSLGLRGAEPSPDHRPNVVLFGDSFTFGQGVEEDETLSEFLAAEDALAAYQFANAGVYDFLPSQAFQLYEVLNAQVNIDVVVIQVGNNDVAPTAAPIRRRVYRGQLNPNPPSSRWGVLKDILRRNSELVAQLRFVMTVIEHLNDETPEYLRSDYPQRNQAALRETAQLLQHWITVAQERGQRVVLLYVPDAPQIQVEPGWDPDIARTWPQRLAQNNPQIGYVDGTEGFREAHRQGQTLFIAGDGHTTAQGNRILARQLRDALLAMNSPGA